MLTAHPTEAKRATALGCHRVYLLLVRSENQMWTPLERRLIREEIKGALERLWRAGNDRIPRVIIGGGIEDECGHSQALAIVIRPMSLVAEVMPRRASAPLGVAQLRYCVSQSRPISFSELTTWMSASFLVTSLQACCWCCHRPRKWALLRQRCYGRRLINILADPPKNARGVEQTEVAHAPWL